MTVDVWSQIPTSRFLSQPWLTTLLTGNYKRGNERDSQRHPRNRGRR